MILNRLKPQITPFTGEDFYIFECINGMYQLRDSRTHMVVSTGTTLESLTRTFKCVLGRYKNYTNYQKAVDNLSEPAIVPRIAKRRAEEYKKVGDRYSDLVNNIIEEYNNSIGTKSLRRSPIGVPSRQEDTTPIEVTSPRKSLLKRRNRLQQ